MNIRDEVLAQCMKNPQGSTQDTLLQNIEGICLEDLVKALNLLLQEGRIQIYQSPNSPDPLYRVIDNEEFERLRGLMPEHILVYRLIEGTQREGAWLKSLKMQSKLQAAQLNKAIKVLEQKQLIKSFKSVMAKNKKIYILYNLQPAVEHQGGVGYGPDLEFDKEYIDELTKQCLQFIVHKGFASLENIRTYIKNSNISRVELQLEDIQKLVDTLIYEGKVELLKNPNFGKPNSKNQAEILYRSSRTQLPLNGVTEVPCGCCPVFQCCNPEGVITPENCQYMKEWLNF